MTERAETAQTHLAARDIVARLSCSETQAYKIMREVGELRFGRLVRVALSDYEEWVQEHTAPPAKLRSPLREPEEHVWDLSAKKRRAG